MAETPERRPDDTTADPDRADLPADLLTIHERLTRDGERWRRRAPDGRNLPAWARATLVASATDTQTQSQPASAPTLRERRLDTLDEQPHAMKGPRPSMATDTSAKPHMVWRGIAGALAATIVVGALAALLIHNAGQRGAGPTATATATVPPTPGPQGTVTPGQGPTQPFVQPAQVPVVAASDLQTLYRVTQNNVIQRSTDGGKQFTTTAQPRTGLDISFTGLAVSPLSAQVVFFNAGGQKNGAGCPEPASYGALAMHGGLLASGFIPCSAQFISQDGGAHWSRLTLPTGGVLGGVTGFLALPFARNAQQSTIVAQGQRLYSAIAFANQGGQLVDSPGARLVASDNGGLTWRLIDDPIIRTGGGVVCDFAVSPTGSTIYATTSPGSCASETYPPISLWRSDDGGRSWIGPIRRLPTLAEAGMVVSSQGWLYTFLPDVTVQGHGASVSFTAANAKVSKDGGKTFTAAPSAGLPANIGQQSGVGLAGPLAALSDGSVVFQIEQGDANGNFHSSLYRWLPGESAWTKIGGSIDGYATAVIVTPNPAGGDTLTAIDFSADTITFTTNY